MDILSRKRRQVERGNSAKELLENPILNEAFEDVENYLKTSWGITKDRETHIREDIWRSLQLLENIRQHIKSVAENGKAANKELLELNNKVKL